MIRQKRMIHFFQQGDGDSSIRSLFSYFRHDVPNEGRAFLFPEAKEMQQKERIAAPYHAGSPPGYMSQTPRPEPPAKTQLHDSCHWVCNSRILSRSFPVKSSRINDNASKCCSVPADKLVAECTTISAPCSIGRIQYGVPNVLSTTRGI